MPITIVTNYTFVTDDGTSYNDTITETIDQDENASAPIRFQCPVGTTREQVLSQGTAEEFGAMDVGTNTIMVINRDDSNAATAYISDTGGDEYVVTLGPNEWHYLPVGGSALQQIDAKFANATGRLEILAFSNPGS